MGKYADQPAEAAEGRHVSFECGMYATPKQCTNDS